MNKPWEQKLEAFEAYLVALLHASHPVLEKAMRYGVEAPSKRLRPWLVFESGGLWALPERDLWPVAAAVELVHKYSLIHDDLPSMDNAAYRSQQFSCWRAFDEATAILAGDGLLPLAFEVLTLSSFSTDTALTLIRKLAQVIGAHGMVAGQMFDLFPEIPLAKKNIATTSLLKTAQLFAFACVAPSIIAGTKQEIQDSLWEFGLCLGQLFQLTHDFLEITANDHSSWTKVLTPPARLQEIKDLQAKAQEMLLPFGEDASSLLAFLDWLSKRSHEVKRGVGG